jgi:hypothetical protein
MVSYRRGFDEEEIEEDQRWAGRSLTGIFRYSVACGFALPFGSVAVGYLVKNRGQIGVV